MSKGGQLQRRLPTILKCLHSLQFQWASYLSCRKRDVLYQQIGMTQHLQQLCTVRLADVAALHLLCMMGKAQAAGCLEACSESSNSQRMQFVGESTCNSAKVSLKGELLSTSYWDPIWDPMHAVAEQP